MRLINCCIKATYIIASYVSKYSLYYSLVLCTLVLFAVIIFASDVGLAVAFEFSQNDFYRMNFSTQTLDYNKDPLTIDVTENSAYASIAGFLSPGIIEGILTLADIAGEEIVGLVIITGILSSRAPWIIADGKNLLACNADRKVLVRSAKLWSTCIKDLHRSKTFLQLPLC
ncbi:MAG: hypothetical protein ACRD8Z_03780 [Nitrososphaeraceae archaeon]